MKVSIMVLNDNIIELFKLFILPYVTQYVNERRHLTLSDKECVSKFTTTGHNIYDEHSKMYIHNDIIQVSV